MNSQQMMNLNQENSEMEINDEIVEQQVENKDDIVYLERPADDLNIDDANVNLDLPVEVWMIILGYVDPQDLPAVAQVNRKFLGKIFSINFLLCKNKFNFRYYNIFLLKLGRLKT